MSSIRQPWKLGILESCGKLVVLHGFPRFIVKNARLFKTKWIRLNPPGRWLKWRMRAMGINNFKLELIRKCFGELKNFQISFIRTHSQTSSYDKVFAKKPPNLNWSEYLTPSHFFIETLESRPFDCKKLVFQLALNINKQHQDMNKSTDINNLVTPCNLGNKIVYKDYSGLPDWKTELEMTTQTCRNTSTRQPLAHNAVIGIWKTLTMKES